MIVFIIFILLMWFVIIPLYKSSRKMRKAKQLNVALERLATLYEYIMATRDFKSVEMYLDSAKSEVADLMADIRFTPQEFVQIAPSITKFLGWQRWM